MVADLGEIAFDASAAETPSSVSYSVVPLSRYIPCTSENVSCKAASSAFLKRLTGICADMVGSIRVLLLATKKIITVVGSARILLLRLCYEATRSFSLPNVRQAVLPPSACCDVDSSRPTQ